MVWCVGCMVGGGAEEHRGEAGDPGLCVQQDFVTQGILKNYKNEKILALFGLMTQPLIASFCTL